MLARGSIALPSFASAGPVFRPARQARRRRRAERAATRRAGHAVFGADDRAAHRIAGHRRRDLRRRSAGAQSAVRQLVRRLRAGRHGAHLSGRRRHARRRAPGRVCRRTRAGRAAERRAAAHSRVCSNTRPTGGIGSRNVHEDRRAARGLAALALAGGCACTRGRRRGVSQSHSVRRLLRSGRDPRRRPLLPDGFVVSFLAGLAAARVARPGALAARSATRCRGCPSIAKYDLPGPLGFSDGSERARFFAEMGHRYSAGVWAPSIRHHQGRFYIYFPTPTEGIFMVSAQDSGRDRGRAPVAVIAEPRLEDPCPFWDDDGQAYLVHSRVGAGPLILHRMSADGTRVLDAGKVIVDDPVNLPVLEGPKLLKRNGWYYIFAPYGGVEKGPQAVLRSREHLRTLRDAHRARAGQTPPCRRRTRAATSRRRRARAGSCTSTAPARTAASCTCSRCAGWTTGRSSASPSRARPPPVSR